MFLIGPPDACCIAMDSKTVNILKVADIMEEKGWKGVFRAQNPAQYVLFFSLYVVVLYKLSIEATMMWINF